MNRRALLKNLFTSSFFLAFAPLARAKEISACQTPERARGLWSESQGYFEIRHRHEFLIPLEVLRNPPAEGYSARTSPPLAGHSDFKGLRERTDDNGHPLDLSSHAHTVKLSQAELLSLAGGGHVTVPLKKFGHSFYFVATDAILAKL